MGNCFEIYNLLDIILEIEWNPNQCSLCLFKLVVTQHPNPHKVIDNRHNSPGTLHRPDGGLLQQILKRIIVFGTCRKLAVGNGSELLEYLALIKDSSIILREPGSKKEENNEQR